MTTPWIDQYLGPTTPAPADATRAVPTPPSSAPGDFGRTVQPLVDRLLQPGHDLQAMSYLSPHTLMTTLLHAPPPSEDAINAAVMGTLSPEAEQAAMRAIPGMSDLQEKWHAIFREPLDMGLLQNRVSRAARTKAVEEEMGHLFHAHVASASLPLEAGQDKLVASGGDLGGGSGLDPSIAGRLAQLVSKNR